MLLELKRQNPPFSEMSISGVSAPVHSSLFMSSFCTAATVIAAVVIASRGLVALLLFFTSLMYMYKGHQIHVVGQSI